MPKDLKVTLSDIEYEILKKIKIVEGDNGEKLRNLLRLYITTVPELKSSEYALKRAENKDEIEEILRDVWEQYELTDYPTELWKEDKINKLTGDLIEINALVKIGEKQYIPSNKFRSLFKMLLHDIATESKDMDEYSAACMATIQLLMEFGVGSLSKETIRDGTIFINEGWMFVYATAMKKAREFMKTKRLFPEAEM
ncbi:MAG: hypothetical protein KKD69_02305 [Euryarchaeota archaeon]|nr:hypothetical protein [Euryarchaeota archaeon]MBU4491274.1 hypothetical protein [Euryarchaeota archaeon]